MLIYTYSCHIGLSACHEGLLYSCDLTWGSFHVDIYLHRALLISYMALLISCRALFMLRYTYSYHTGLSACRKGLLSSCNMTWGSFYVDIYLYRTLLISYRALLLSCRSLVISRCTYIGLLWFRIGLFYYHAGLFWCWDVPIHIIQGSLHVIKGFFALWIWREFFSCRNIPLQGSFDFI